MNLEMWQVRAKQDIVLTILPQQLVLGSDLSAYGRIQQMNMLRHTCMMLIREICEKQLEST